MIGKFYFWLWHDVLHLHEPISWIIVHSMRDHTLTWQLCGGVVNAIIWTLFVHFISML